MRVPLAWLKRVLRPRPRRPTEIGAALSLSGTELERIVRVGRARPATATRASSGSAR